MIVQMCLVIILVYKFFFNDLGGLPSGSYIQILCPSMPTSSYGMKTLELKILMLEGKYAFL